MDKKKQEKSKEHEYSIGTGYCVHCGQSSSDIFDYKLQCHRYHNITAISHRVRKNVLRTTTKNLNFSS
jgi:hypothetical protein